MSQICNSYDIGFRNFWAVLFQANLLIQDDFDVIIKEYKLTSLYKNYLK